MRHYSFYSSHSHNDIFKVEVHIPDLFMWNVPCLALESCIVLPSLFVTAVLYRWLLCLWTTAPSELGPKDKKNNTTILFFLVVYANTCSWFYFLIFKDLLEICTINTINIINPKGLKSFFPVLKAFEFQRNLCNKLWKSWSYLIFI